MTVALLTLLFYKFDGLGNGVLLSGISYQRHCSTAGYVRSLLKFT